jgi:hypothetical protein
MVFVNKMILRIKIVQINVICKLRFVLITNVFQLMKISTISVRMWNVIILKFAHSAHVSLKIINNLFANKIHAKPKMKLFAILGFVSQILLKKMLIFVIK